MNVVVLEIAKKYDRLWLLELEVKLKKDELERLHKELEEKDLQRGKELELLRATQNHIEQIRAKIGDLVDKIAPPAKDSDSVH